MKLMDILAAAMLIAFAAGIMTLVIATASAMMQALFG